MPITRSRAEARGKNVPSVEISSLKKASFHVPVTGQLDLFLFFNLPVPTTISILKDHFWATVACIQILGVP